jgi:hypothetical protein
MAKRLAQFVIDLIVASALAGITFAITEALGYSVPFWIIWIFWFALCTVGWIVIICRNDNDGGSDGDGFWKWVIDAVTGN